MPKPKLWKKLIGKSSVENENGEYLFVVENKIFCFEVILFPIDEHKYTVEYWGYCDEIGGIKEFQLKYKTLEEGILKLNIIIPKMIKKIMRGVYRRNNQEIEFLMRVDSKITQRKRR